MNNDVKDDTIIWRIEQVLLNPFDVESYSRSLEFRVKVGLPIARMRQDISLLFYKTNLSIINIYMLTFCILVKVTVLK